MDENSIRHVTLSGVTFINEEGRAVMIIRKDMQRAKPAFPTYPVRYWNGTARKWELRRVSVPS